MMEDRVQSKVTDRCKLKQKIWVKSVNSLNRLESLGLAYVSGSHPRRAPSHTRLLARLFDLSAWRRIVWHRVDHFWARQSKFRRVNVEIPNEMWHQCPNLLGRRDYLLEVATAWLIEAACKRSPLPYHCCSLNCVSAIAKPTQYKRTGLLLSFSSEFFFEISISFSPESKATINVLI